jgi:hypothetical protein
MGAVPRRRLEPNGGLGGPKCKRRMELPRTELPFDFHLAPSGRGQIGRQASRPASHLFRLGKALLGEPPAVTGLERVGQTAQVSEGKRGDAGANGQSPRSVRARQLERAEALKCPPER